MKKPNRRSFLLASAAIAAIFAGQIEKTAAQVVISGYGTSTPPGTILSQFTVQDLSNTNQTNVPITFGVPLSQTALVSGNTLQLVNGSSVYPLQLDNMVQDNNSANRFVAATAIVPSLMANEIQSLELKVVPGSPSTGTDILASDLAAAGFDHVSTIVDVTGTYTASAAAALATGTWTTWNTGGIKGNTKAGGGYATGFFLIAPYETSGGARHAQQVCFWEVLAFKAQPGPVSGGNPIIAVRVDRWNENATIQITQASLNAQVYGGNDGYDITDQCGTNTVSFVGLANTNSLTVSATTGTVTVTAPSAIFSAQSGGMFLTDGTGYGLVESYVTTSSGTQVKVRVYKAFATSGTWASGSYTWRGTNQPLGARWRQRLWWSGAQQPNVAAYIGKQFNFDGNNGGGPYAYFKSSQMVLNYSPPQQNPPYVNGAGQTCKPGTPTNRWGSISTNPMWSDGTYFGDFITDENQTGQSTDQSIGPVPGYQITGLMYFDFTTTSNVISWQGQNGIANTAIFGNGDKLCQQQMFWRDTTTGLTCALNSGTDYFLRSSLGHAPNLLAQPASPNVAISPIGLPASNHQPEGFYLPYLLSGDFYWLDALGNNLFWTVMQQDPGAQGSQLSRKTIVGQLETRNACWNHRTLAHALICNPGNSIPLGITRSQLNTFYAKSYTDAGSGNISPYGTLIADGQGAYPWPGLNAICTNNTSWFTPEGISYNQCANTGNGVYDDLITPWSLNYLNISLKHFWEIGLLGSVGSDGYKYYEFQTSGLINVVNDSITRMMYLVPAYEPVILNTDSMPWVLAKTIPDVYKQAGSCCSIELGGNKRTLNSPITLSAVSGSSITVTLPTNTFATGGAGFYVGGGLIDNTNASAFSTIGTLISAGGSGYVNGDVITISVTTLPAGVVQTRPIKVTVTGSSGGVISSVSISDPGLFEYNTNPAPFYLSQRSGSSGASVYWGTQASTTGSGTGFQLGSNGSNGVLVAGGAGVITAVSGDTITIDTTGTTLFHPVLAGNQISPVPFATATIAGNEYFIPWPYPGDTIGTDRAAYWGSNFAAYTAFAQNALITINEMGFSGAAAALAAVNANYSGGSEINWGIAAR